MGRKRFCTGCNRRLRSSKRTLCDGCTRKQKRRCTAPETERAGLVVVIPYEDCRHLQGLEFYDLIELRLKEMAVAGGYIKSVDDVWPLVADADVQTLPDGSEKVVALFDVPVNT